MNTEEIKHRAVRSVIALTARTIFLQLVSVGAFFLLGIFLSPKAIGIFIIVSALIRIFSLFTDVGLGAALIQKKEDLDDEDLKTTFFIQEILVVLAILLGLLVTPWVVKYASLSPDGVFLYRVLLLTLFISSLKVIPSILLERKLAFEVQIIPQILETLVFNVLVVFLAFKGFEVAAYAWAFLASAIVSLPVYYFLSPWRIALGFSWSRAWKLLSYGLQFQGKNVLAVIKDDLLTFFLSGIVGSVGIGYWGWAQRWAYSPFRLIGDSVTKVTFPAYSRIQDDLELLKRGIEKSLFAVSSILFPILAFASVFISSLIHLIPRYAKWEPALPSFYLLCAQAVISAVSSILINVLDATGHVKTTLRLMVMWIILTWVLTILAVTRFGFTGIAFAQLLTAFTIVITFILVRRIVPFNFIGPVFKPVIAVMISIIPVLVFTPNVLTGLIGAIIYVGAMLILARRETFEVLSLIRKAYKK